MSKEPSSGLVKPKSRSFSFLHTNSCRMCWAALSVSVLLINVHGYLLRSFKHPDRMLPQEKQCFWAKRTLLSNNLESNFTKFFSDLDPAQLVSDQTLYRNGCCTKASVFTSINNVFMWNQSYQAAAEICFEAVGWRGMLNVQERLLLPHPIQVWLFRGITQRGLALSPRRSFTSYHFKWEKWRRTDSFI